MEKRLLIYDLDLPEITRQLADWGEPGYRAGQVWEGLYQHLWSSASEFTTLPRGLRERLAAIYDFQHLKLETLLSSHDGETRKALFRVPDGEPVETVLMGYARRKTLCISTQAGCAMGCAFCATGQMGFRRNLSSGEIVEQVITCARWVREEGNTVTNVVVMGMGEPFHNYDQTMAALERLNHHQGFNLGARRFTISTVGLVPMIQRFAREKHPFNLAVSLHAADDELRSSMLPVNRRYPLEQVLAACLDYVRQTHRRVSFEWALIREVNDTPEQARKLATRLAPFVQGGAALCHVNAIPLNPTDGYSGKASPRERAQRFREELEQHGIPCTIRLRRGIDIRAGCGQLAGKKSPGKDVP